MSELLFTYGTLSPETPEAAVLGGWEPDAVRGRLYDLGPYPAIVDIDVPEAPWISGYVRVVELAMLEGPFDAYEEVAEGLFRRDRVTSRSGELVWVYHYARIIPDAARIPIDRWQGRRIDPSDPIQLRPFW